MIMADKFFKEENFWRRLTNLWTLVTIIYLVADFYFHNSMEYLMGPVLAIYIGILTIYAGTKEFDRWNDYHSSKHPGEWYVILWTILMIVLMLLNVFANNEYRLSSEIIATYIAVMGIFALTQKSKEFFKHKKDVAN